MKRRKLIAVLGSVVLSASVGITACQMKTQEDTTKETTAEETTEETTTIEEEEDLCGCAEAIDPACEEYYYSCPGFVSTNGELEGQSEYMTLCPDWESIDWNRYPDDPEDMKVSDLSIFENETIRTYAEELVRDGYSINDPDVDQQFGNACGDGEYQFCIGFTAYRVDAHSSEYISAYMMNETLFNHFFVEWYVMEEEPVTDDGTVIRYGYDNFYVEYNRDTGIGIIYSGCTSDEGVG